MWLRQQPRFLWKGSARYELCGPDYLSTNELAHIIGHQVDREDIVARFMSPEDFFSLPFIEGLTDYGIDVLQRLFTYYNRQGIFGNPNVLTWLLGRAPTTFTRYVQQETKESSH